MVGHVRQVRGSANKVPKVTKSVGRGALCLFDESYRTKLLESRTGMWFGPQIRGITVELTNWHGIELIPWSSPVVMQL